MRRIATFLILAACGGGKGGGLAISGSTPLVVLTEAQRMQLCQQASNLVVQRTADCGDGSTVTVTFTVDDCLGQIEMFPSSCEATVDDMLDCSEDFGESSDQEICRGEQPASCDALISCIAIEG